MRKNGFSLMEIMIVIVILSLIVGFGLPSYSKAIEKNRARRVRMNLIGFHAALTTFEAQTGTFPATGLNLGGLNGVLGTNILDDSFGYTFTNPGGGSFSLVAVHNDNLYKFTLTQAVISPANPVCADLDGNCPAL